ncbi:MAG TPA: TerC family protein [Bryobacteraceae bacterium]|jgi:tellurite resistance protein TerC|nr:TerC family protein [Bryobacteraceae bacterium]
MSLFAFAEYWWFYLAFTGLIIVLLAVDLGLFNRRAHEIGFREAGLWVLAWAVLSAAFGYGLYLYASARFGGAVARRLALEFATGYLVEQALSVDNMFVFVLIFGYFAIPRIYQHRVLFYGILGALIFRAIFIALGAALLRYEWVVVLFGIFLIFTGARMFFGEEKEIEPEKNLVLRIARRFLPLTTSMHGQRFIAREGGVMVGTPLLVTLLVLEFTDILFAIDSVPAIFAVTREPLVVFTSNVLAILGLRSMYFLLAGAVGKFHLLRYGLGIILVFIGLKMAWLNELWHGEFPISWSLAFIGIVLAVTIGLSLLFPRRQRAESPAPAGKRDR